ncbi:PH domain-containing protein [Candidatus Gracilibacteria bacterium]|nr:PH domain-containing protein [Candidatus Gracilibacteria bacterium]
MVKKEHISLLKENEQVVMTLHRHWIILVYHFLYFITFIITTWILLAYKGPIIELLRYEAIYWAGITIYWIAFLTFILLDWINDELDLFIITDSRVIGIEQISTLSRRVTECSLDRVQEVNANTAGVLQTLFGFGDVHIHTASETSNMIVNYAPDPIENARRINNVIQAYRNAHLPNGQTNPPA